MTNRDLAGFIPNERELEELIDEAEERGDLEEVKRLKEILHQQKDAGFSRPE